MVARSPGSCIGPYELVAAIGAGGMGEVWKARDKRLDRTVAIKFSHDQFTDRFRSEARAIAALNHPNIATLHDVGDDYLVMEYVEGEPVRQFDDTRLLLDVAVQIADGLAAAHAAGFIHRDLKPDNILVGKSGRVKILDFGLAKQLAASASADQLTRTVSISQPGFVVGTIAYMSPEQARAYELDARSDQFSFGLILYELATGRRAFQRDSTVETMSAIIRDDPEPLPISLPAPLRWIIERCLAKDPENRYDSTRDLYRELRNVRDRLSEASITPVRQPSPSSRPRWWILPTAVAVAALAGAIAVVLLLPRESFPNTRLRIAPLAIEPDEEYWSRFSPDGRSIAFIRNVRETGQVFVRSLIGGNATQLTDGKVSAELVGWSRDGGTIHYFSGGLRAISVSGGSPRELKCDVKGVRQRFTITPDEKSIISVRQVREERGAKLSLFSWPVGGGEGKLIADLPFEEENQVGRPAFSPDGTKLLIGHTNGAGVVISWPGGKVREAPSIRDAYYAAWMPDSRHAVFTTYGGTQLVLSDTESSARQLLLAGKDGWFSVSASPDGQRLAIDKTTTDFDVLEFDVSGRLIKPLRSTAVIEHSGSWSRDGKSFAWYEDGSGIWIGDQDGSGGRLLASDPAAVSPAFSPDGRRVAFRKQGGVFVVLAAGGPQTMLKDVSTRVERVRSGGICWSPDGKWLAYTDGSVRGGELWKVESGGGHVPVKIASDARNGFGRTGCGWSPDGRQIAYSSDGGISVVSMDGGTPRLVDRALASVAWDVGGKLLVPTAEGTPPVAKLLHIDPANGTRTAEIPLALPNAYHRRPGLPGIHPDGKRIALTFSKGDSDIYVLEGFAQPETGWRRLFRHWADPPNPPSSVP